MCNDTVIAEQWITTNSEGFLEELVTPTLTNLYSFNLNSGFSEEFLYTCTDYSLLEDWQTGRGHIRFPLNSTNNKSFYTFEFNGCCWIDTLVEGASSSWKVQMTVNTSVRADTGRMNASPRIDFPPLVRLKYGCSHTIRLPVMDADGDAVRCRWARQTESDGVSRSFSRAVLHEIEDFNPRAAPGAISSVPLQFLVSIEGDFTNCTVFEHERPQFVNFTLPDMACIGVTNQSDFTTDIYIQSGAKNQISEVKTVSPLGLVKSALQQTALDGHWHVQVTWNPDHADSVDNVFCFTAVDDNGMSSEQRCITLLAGVPAAEAIPGSQSPNDQVVPVTQHQWTVVFNRPDLAPTRPAYMYLYLANGTLVEQIDVASASGVTYSHVTNNTRLQFQTTARLSPGQQYYFLLGQGLVQGKDYCGADSKPVMDPTFWRFSVGSYSTLPRYVEFRCFLGLDRTDCDGLMSSCAESWQFSSPCSSNPGHLRFSYPGAVNKFILCDLQGKAYVAHCPPGEVCKPYV
ncbi:hypothetical protein MAR_024010 [Mya arenaria]|uniref:Uncharacterized protein n=1 Tax=Mya arenaria TaxID=6604 RepID=A0ABY7DPL5_MYAAR|nr:hypothetical protein MAR_024010 [Mya arenaria]